MCWVAFDRGLRIAGQARPARATRTAGARARRRSTRRSWRSGWSPERRRLRAVLRQRRARRHATCSCRWSSSWARPTRACWPRSSADRAGPRLRQPGLPLRPRRAPTTGWPAAEGTFSMCTFWLVECLTRAGAHRGGAADLREDVHLRQPPGPLRRGDRATGEALGNFPQAFTHLALIRPPGTSTGPWARTDARARGDRRPLAGPRLPRRAARPHRRAGDRRRGGLLHPGAGPRRPRAVRHRDRHGRGRGTRWATRDGAVHDPVDLEAARLRPGARGPRARAACARRRRADRRAVQLDQASRTAPGSPSNPMVNAGAIVTTSLAGPAATSSSASSRAFGRSPAASSGRRGGVRSERAPATATARSRT